MRNFRIAAAIALVALSLGGCAGGDLAGKLKAITAIATLDVKNPVSTTTIASVESAYGIALAAAVAYRENYDAGNRCTKTRLESATNLCSRRSIVEGLRAADDKATAAIDAAKDYIARNPTLNARSLIDAAQTAVGAYRNLTAR